MKKMILVKIGICLFLIFALMGTEVSAKPSKKGISVLADQLLKEEAATLESASAELMKFAQKAASQSYNKMAFETASLAALLYPRDRDLAKLIKTYNSKGIKAPESFIKEKEAVYSKAAKYMVQYGDSMFKHGGFLLAEWAYKMAEKMGYPVDKKKLQDMEKPLEEFNKSHNEMVSGGKCDLVKAPGTGYQYRFKLPASWTINNEWPVSFVFHGTGGAWGNTRDNEETALKIQCPKFANFIVISIREPSMILGHHPDIYNTVEAMEEILAIMMVCYRANPRAVMLKAGGSGALCCWPYLEKFPQRLCGVEIAMGKFQGIGLKKGSVPAINVPVRLGLYKSPNITVGTSGTTQAQHDQVHIQQTSAAKSVLEKLGFTRLEWFPDNFQLSDISWFYKCADEKARRCKALAQ